MKKNRWVSRKWWVCLWAIIVTTGLTTWSMLREWAPNWLGILLPLLVSIIVTYTGVQGLVDHQELKNINIQGNMHKDTEDMYKNTNKE